MTSVSSHRRSVPFIEQMQQTECGICCVAMIAGYYKSLIPMRTLRETADVGRDGASLLLPEDDEELEKICPICKINYMNPDEEMCFMCTKEKADKSSEPDWEDFEKEQ